MVSATLEYGFDVDFPLTPRLWLVIAAATLVTTLASYANTYSFVSFPSNATHDAAAVAAAIANVPTNVGVVYDANGQTNDIQIWNYGSGIYTGAVDVSSTLQRIRNNQSVANTESDDGGFFNFHTNEFPNIPRKGTNYYMEFMVWPYVDLTNNSYSTDYEAYGQMIYPGAMRLLIGLGGEVYFTGDHYGEDGPQQNAYYLVPSPSQAAGNSWTNNTGGKWEIAHNWLFSPSAPSAAPSVDDPADLITNASNKTITLDGVTAGYTANLSVLSINNLVLSAPSGSTNTLLLSALFTNELQIATSLSVLSGGLLTINGGSLAVSGSPALQIDGGALLSGGELIVTNQSTFIGDTGNGSLTVTNGTWLTHDVWLGLNSGSVGTLTVAGGTNRLSSGLILGAVDGSTGTVWMTGGQLTVTNVATSIGVSGIGRMTVSNGTWRAAAVALGFYAGSRGVLTVAGGTNLLSSSLDIGLLAGGTGEVWVTGGQLIVTNNSATYLGEPGNGELTVSNGICQTGAIAIGEGGQGTFRVAGGTGIVEQAMYVGYSSGGTGNVWITGGQLLATAAGVEIGADGIGFVTVSNGTCQASDVLVGGTSDGTFTIAGGQSIITSNLTVGSADCTITGVVRVTGGGLYVTNSANTAVLDVGSGTLELDSGSIYVDTLVMTNPCGRIVLSSLGSFHYNGFILDPSLDQDGDGIPTLWEEQHGLNPLYAGDASLDPDGDGMSNLQEYLAGTDPNNSASYFHITSIAPEGNDLRITWMTGPGRTNALYRGDSLTNITTEIFAVTNTTGTITNYLDIGAATNTPALFYRVELVP